MPLDTIWIVAGPRTPAAAPEWPIVARTHLAGEIIGGLASLPARVQLLTGPAGVGKSVLASSIAAEDERTVIHVIALAELAGVPLGAFGPALAQLNIPSEPARAVPTLMSAIGSAADSFLLVVDDIPRLDDVSAAVVYQLVRAFGVPTLATARLGEKFPAPVQRMIDEGLTKDHEVGGLTVSQVRELLDRRFGASVRDTDVIRLTERTTGNPLYLRVLVERAQRTGEVYHERDAVHINEGDAPAGLIDEMSARLMDLGAAERRVLRLTAVLQPVSRAVLATTAHELTQLTALEQRGLVAVDPGSGRIRVTHPLIVESLDRDHGTELDVGDVLARLRATGDVRDRLLAVRLELQDSAGAPTEELAWAASYAYGTGDLTAAAEFSTALLTQHSRRADRCAALTTLASTRSLQGDHAEAESAFAEAELLAETPEELALIAVRRGEHLSYRRHDLAGAVAQAERIRARINASYDVLEDSLRQWDASLDIIAGMPLLGRLAFRLKPELAIRAAILLVVSRSTRGDLSAARHAIDELSGIQKQIGQVDPLASAAVGFARFVELISPDGLRKRPIMLRLEG